MPNQPLYRYGVTLRPPGWGGSPRGEVVEERAADPRFPFGSIAYREKLPREVVEQFSLTPVRAMEQRGRLLPRLLEQMRTAPTSRRMRTLGRRYHKLGGDPTALRDDIQDRIFALARQDMAAERAAAAPKPQPPTYRTVETKRGGKQLSFLNPDLPWAGLAALAIGGWVAWDWWHNSRPQHPIPESEAFPPYVPVMDNWAGGTPRFDEATGTYH